MRLFKKIFSSRKRKNKEDEQVDLREESKTLEDVSQEIKGLSFTISSDDDGISFSSSPVGTATGSKAKDFYLYQWFIKKTGEIFYVGKGRGNRYKAFHERAYEAEKIRKMYDTDSRFVAIGLTEEEAIGLESKEIARILNETNDRLTNRMIPLFTKRNNGYHRSSTAPKLKFETAPYLYATEIDEHYFDTKHRAFDEVKDENLNAVVFITKGIRNEVNTIYDGDYNKYLDETKNLLLMNGSKVMATQFAKSATAWIFIGDDDVVNYEVDQEKALERLGRNMPTYHLLDVRKYLMDKLGEVKIASKESVSINPTHNRVPIESTRNLNDWKKGYDEGKPYWDKGELLRKEDNLEEAIKLFDKARFNGYDAPALYRSYALAYRKLKDYDNEIAIIDEAVDRTGSEGATTINQLKVRREKAVLLRKKQDI